MGSGEWKVTSLAEGGVERLKGDPKGDTESHSETATDLISSAVRDEQRCSTTFTNLTCALHGSNVSPNLAFSHMSHDPCLTQH